MKRLVTFFVGLAVLAVGSLASADVIVVDETFSTDGALVGTTPSPGPGGVWAEHSPGDGSGLAIDVVGGEAVLIHGAGSRQDANTSFAAQTSGTVRYTLDFSVDDLGTPFSGTDFEYFVSFGATDFVGGSSLVGRVDLVAPSATGDFGIGIATFAGSADAVWGEDFNYGESISILVDYDIDNNQAFLAVNGGTAIAAALVGANSTSIDDLSLRQSNSSNDETVRVDNLKVFVLTPVPEPGSLGVLAMFGLVGLLRRRK